VAHDTASTAAAAGVREAEAQTAPPRGGPLASLAVPSFPLLWASGFLWNLTRWMAIFLGSYLVNDLSGSPFLVQLAGSAFFAPMLFGGVVAGVVADRFDRRRTLLNQLFLLTAVAAAMCVIVASGAVQTWMIYPFMAAVGLGGVIDLTSRRALVYDLVGEERVTNALALESLGSSLGNMLGAATGGAIIQFVGIGEAFGLIAVCYAGAFVLLLGVPRPVQRAAATETRASLVDDLRAGLRYVLHDRTLISLLGVTVLVNLFFFSFLPIVPVFADRLDVGPFLTGVLVSGMGIGMVIGSLAIAAFSSRRRGLLYVGGAFVAMALLLGFALVPVYWIALLCLIIAGTGMAGFATMQSVLVMAAAGAAMRGRAMGILSMAIGALPIGMIGLGLAAEGIGPVAGVSLSVTIGLAAMVVWLLIRPESAHMR
jgi:predicted MFS family arabinose efflux permease